ncbi:primosomal replication protein [Vibrio sp. JC009]|uniref:primosomal replication protein n=1 Tax=Vibrio sp. JC009 TaxID=2912314 RepID=UPI0023B1844F|nr:primosomal replication protein [Vibrio sp. JC009]WED22729.1 primosomal replication protein [Vibrio sp. JC009]
MNKFEQLEQTLETLVKQASLLDRKRGEHYQPLFDERLFGCRAKLLLPCVEEAQGVLETLIREQSEGKLTSASAEYLTEHLVDQVSAISRELSTEAIRKSEIRHGSHYRKPINLLYQDLAQHQEWERRLKEMVRNKKLALQSASPAEAPGAQQALIATERRLIKCQAAKLKIEKQINYRERKQ